MAHPDTHRSQAKSLLKRGLITEKQHAKMMARIDALPPPAPADGGAPGAAPDPQLSAGVTPAPASQVPVTVSVPGDPNATDDPRKPQQPPAA